MRHELSFAFVDSTWRNVDSTIGTQSGERDVKQTGDARLSGYLAATFGASWVLWGLAAAISSESTDIALRTVYFLPGTFAPGLVGLWFIAGNGGRRAVADLISRLFAWTVPVRWYGFALGYMIAVKLIAAVIYRLTTSSWPLFDLLPWYVPFAIGISTVMQAGEEIGWRGIVLPALARRAGLRLGSIVLGGIWAVWHVPLFLIPGTDLSGQPMAPFLLGVTALSVPMAWLYVRTGGSLLLVMVMHATVNNTSQLVPAMPPGTLVVDGRIAWLTAAVLWLGALAILPMMSRGEMGADVSPASHADE